MAKPGRRQRSRERGSKPVAPSVPPAQPVVRSVAQAAAGSNGPNLQARRSTVWLLLLGLCALLFFAYLRVLNAEFLRWDDQYYVVENPLLKDPEGLSKIWDPFARATQQYYPLTFSSYWLEYQLWGLDARGYHAVNVLLHGINVLLLVAFLRELGLSAGSSAFGAGLFALHPVQVASVAWIAERKNVLAGAFVLISLLAFTRFLKHSRVRAFVLSWVAFLLAMLSKTQVAALPLALFTLGLVLQPGSGGGGRPGGAITLRGAAALGASLLPFFAVAAALSLLTIAYEVKEWTPEFPLLDRLLIAANALGFYVRTILMPIGLSPIYPQWQLDRAAFSWWLAPLLFVVLGALAWQYRSRIPLLCLWGCGFFLFLLLPVLGLRTFNFFTYSFVADHFVYFSMIGVSVAVARAWDLLPAETPPTDKAFGRVRHRLWGGFAGTVLVVLALLTQLETRHWRDNLSFWLRVRERDPRGFLALYNLGNHFRERGEWAQAAEYYASASAIRPRADYAFRRYVDAVRRAEGALAAVEACDKRLAAQPGFPAAYLERGISLEHLGQVAEASEAYREALRLSPRGSPIAFEAQQALQRLASQ